MYMSHRFSILGVLLASMLPFGCGGEAPRQGSAKAASPEKVAEVAKTEVVPGSYEDWCDEHAVPESQCTRCNAALIPAFKATGDWCELHQLPTSQDLADNPDLKIERPLKPEEGTAKEN